MLLLTGWGRGCVSQSIREKERTRRRKAADAERREGGRVLRERYIYSTRWPLEALNKPPFSSLPFFVLTYLTSNNTGLSSAADLFSGIARYETNPEAARQRERTVQSFFGVSILPNQAKHSSIAYLSIERRGMIIHFRLWRDKSVKWPSAIHGIRLRNLLSFRGVRLVSSYSASFAS